MSIKSKSGIITALADDVISSIQAEVIIELENRHDTSSGDDTGLSNLWEEVCVQIQGTHSYFWRAYDDMVYTLVTEAMDKRPDYQLIAVWLQTDDGIDGYYDEDRDRDEALAWDPGAVANSIVSYLYGAASDYRNEAIENYLAI